MESSSPSQKKGGRLTLTGEQMLMTKLKHTDEFHRICQVVVANQRRDKNGVVW
jgi:hypothetical protein